MYKYTKRDNFTEKSLRQNTAKQRRKALFKQIKHHFYSCNQPF